MTDVYKDINELDHKNLLKLLANLKKGQNGEKIDLSMTDVSFNETLDGIDSVIGIDDKKDFFFIQTDSDEFDDVDEVEQILLKNSRLQTVLEDVYEDYGPFSLRIDLFPSFSHEGDENRNVIFNVLSYDKDKFGKEGAIVIKEVKGWSPVREQWEAMERNEALEIVDRVKEVDNRNWRIYGYQQIRLNDEINLDISKLERILNDENKIQSALRVLDNPEGETQRKILEDVLNTVHKELVSEIHKLMKNTNSNFGKLNEKSKIKGFEISYPLDEKSYGSIVVERPVYEKMKKDKYTIRERLKKTYYETRQKIFDILGLDLNPNDLSGMSEALDKTVRKFRSSKMGEARYYDFVKMIQEENSLQDSMYDESEIYNEVKEVLREASVSMSRLANEIEELQTDNDTKNKAINIFEKVQKRFNFINNYSHRKQDNYKTYLTNFMLSPYMEDYNEMIEGYIDENGQNISLADAPENVILWVGHAQPWTRDHHYMIQEAKSYMTECDANKIYLMIVGLGYEDDDSSTGFEATFHNPFSYDTRRNLVESFYENDSLVEVCPRPVNFEDINSILETTFLKENKKVVGVICENNTYENSEKIWKETFDKEHWQSEMCPELPIDHDGEGVNVKLYKSIDKSYKMSEVRQNAYEMGLDSWMNRYCPRKFDEKVKAQYEKMYQSLHDRMSKHKEEEYHNKIKKAFWGKTK